jgi:hypothetical protein
MKGRTQNHPLLILWKRGQIYLVVGGIKISAAKMLASIGARTRVDLKFDVLRTPDIAKVNPEAVTLLIATDAIDPQKFCNAHREIRFVIQADDTYISIADIQSGKIKNYVLAFGNAAEVAQQLAEYA